MLLFLSKRLIFEKYNVTLENQLPSSDSFLYTYEAMVRKGHTQIA